VNWFTIGLVLSKTARAQVRAHFVSYACVNCGTHRTRESAYAAKRYLPGLAPAANGGFFLRKAVRTVWRAGLLGLRAQTHHKPRTVPNLDAVFIDKPFCLVDRGFIVRTIQRIIAVEMPVDPSEVGSPEVPAGCIQHYQGAKRTQVKSGGEAAN
jgi:hypothetical protein